MMFLILIGSEELVVSYCSSHSADKVLTGLIFDMLKESADERPTAAKVVQILKTFQKKTKKDKVKVSSTILNR